MSGLSTSAVPARNVTITFADPFAVMFASRLGLITCALECWETNVIVAANATRKKVDEAIVRLLRESTQINEHQLKKSDVLQSLL